MIKRVGIKFVKRLTYFLLTLLSVIAITGYFVIENIQQAQNKDSYNISIVSKQRTLVLKISREVLAINSSEKTDTTLVNKLTEYNSSLKKTYEDFISNERVKRLIDKYPELANVANRSRLNKEQIVDGIETILQNPEDEILVDKGVQLILQNDEEFISQVEKVIYYYVVDARENISRLRYTRIIFISVLLFVLLVFGFILFRPTIKEAEANLKQLIDVKTQLEENNKELEVKTTLLEESIENIEKSNKQLENFTYIISHDLKSPLRAINNLSEWIQEDLADKVDGETKSHLVMLKSRVERLNNLIEGVLEYSRAARLTREATPVNVNDLVNQLAFELNAAEKVVIPEPLPNILTNEQMLSKVFFHLIKNALQYNKNDEPRVEVSCVSKKGSYLFSVKDNGVGIAKENLEVIFGMFRTLQPKDKEETKGVGLAIAERIIRDIGGKITVESELGKGSTFMFEWPTVIT